jgi:hypothetical protein
VEVLAKARHGLVVDRNCVEVIRGGEQRKTNVWRVVKRTGFGLLGWRAGSFTAKPRMVVDAEGDESSDPLTLMDGCRRDAWKFVCSKQGELSWDESAAAVRGSVVALKPGNAGGAKGSRLGDVRGTNR